MFVCFFCVHKSHWSFIRTTGVLKGKRHHLRVNYKRNHFYYLISIIPNLHEIFCMISWHLQAINSCAYKGHRGSESRKMFWLCEWICSLFTCPTWSFFFLKLLLSSLSCKFKNRIGIAETLFININVSKIWICGIHCKIVNWLWFSKKKALNYLIYAHIYCHELQT